MYHTKHIIFHTSNMKSNLVVFTDGSCSRNGKAGAVGGIGIHFPDAELPDVSKVFGKEKCTNQRTELYAIFCALRYIDTRLGLAKYRVYVKTDSKYSINCVTEWAEEWISNGWVTKTGTPVANKDLIESILPYYDKHTVVLEYVEGHSDVGDYNAIGNGAADKLATDATKKAIRAQNNQAATRVTRAPRKTKPNISGSKTNRKLPAKETKKSAARDASTSPRGGKKSTTPRGRPTTRATPVRKQTIAKINNPPKDLNRLVVELVPFRQYN